MPSIDRLVAHFFSKRSYAQDGEDLVLESLMGESTPKHGFFIDVGAHHPFRFSNTYVFYRRGWRGINIEPSARNCRLLRWFRPRDINLQVGVGKVRSHRDYYVFHERALNTFDKDRSEHLQNHAGYSILRRETLELVPLSEILDVNMVPNTTIDFMSVDVENYDLEVLQSNDWNRYRPKYLLVEDLNFNVQNPAASSIHTFLAGKNYALTAVLRRTLIYKSIS